MTKARLSLPLSVVNDRDINDSEEPIAECYVPAIAEEIVRSVNAYDTLRTYCRHAHALLAQAHEPYIRSQRHLNNTRAAQRVLAEALDATRQVVTDE